MTAAFDSVDHVILLERLRCTFEISDVALAWFSGRTQSVRLRDEQSDFQAVPHGVPRGSVLGPLLFILYTAELSYIATKHHINVHFYADDTQLYLTCQRDDTAACTSRLAACITEIGDWMAFNRLLLNHHEMFLLWCLCGGS